MSLFRRSAQAALLLGLVSLSIPTVHAQAGQKEEKPEVKLPELVVGSKAPALTIDKWIKGQPVASFEKGKVYMVEFWATWCPPCIRSMPHISELQKKYGPQGLTVIGVSAKDRNGNTLEKAEKMVADKGDTMGYTVAWDKDRETMKAWFDAAGQEGIPCSFLVDQNGTIAYIGLPSDIDKTLESVMANKHDIKALAADYKKQKEAEAKVQALGQAVGEAIQAEDWPTAVKTLDQIIALDPKNYAQAAIARFRIETKEMKDYAKATSDATAYFIDGPGKDDAQALNALAWNIVDPESELGHVDIDLALKLSMRANELTKNEDAAIMDTLARTYFTKGDFDKAVEVETKAVEKSADNKKLQKDLQKSLEEFKDAQAKKSKG